jgi:hypothetical protein
MKANSALIPEINAVLTNAGLAPIKTAQDWFNFTTGKANKQVYDTYEAATMRGAAHEAGLSLSVVGAARLAGSTVGITDFAQSEQNFKDIADKLKTAGPELNMFGITQAELQTIEFGGANRSQLAAKAEQALRQRQAALSNDLARPAAQLQQQGRPIVSSGQEAGF